MASPRPSQVLRPPSKVDPRVWWACAGPSSRLPPIGSPVYYFPEGHAEHAWHPPDLSAVFGGGGSGVPFFRCRVADTSLLANPGSDEVFSKIHLEPSLSAAAAAVAEAWSGGGGGDDGGMAWFVKILTTSDANCGGGFSVPRSCAEHIFPLLDLDAERPVQRLLISDLHGTVWNFRHIYRGTPRRHLLTTGWSGFAHSKRLVSGDAIIFVKDKSNGDLFVGLRRALRLFDADSPLPPLLAEIDPEEDERTISKLGFTRCVRGRIPSANVVEAARSANLGRPFEVLYYPKAGLPEFVVPEAEVDAAMRVPWKVGMRVTLSVEGEDPFAMRDVWGTVAGIAERGAKSPWRMLQVTWDEPEVMKNRGLNKVSPWQVEMVSSTPALQTQYFETPLLTKWRVLENSGSLGNERTCRVLENSGSLGDDRTWRVLENSGNNILIPESESGETVNSVVLQSPEHPAGMQGARQDLICFLPIKENKVASSSSSIDSTSQQAENVRGEMNIANISHSSSTHPGQEAMLNGGSEPFHSSAFSQPAGVRTVVLFGQTIIIEQSSAGGGAEQSSAGGGADKQ